MAEIQARLTGYLQDAHSIEKQALAQLRVAPSLAEVAAMASAFNDHLVETERHEQTVTSLLSRRDAAAA